MSAGDMLVELQGVGKRYDDFLLHIDHLALDKGLIYGVIGPSGSGKSTLLRIINLLTAPSYGTYRYQGRPAELSGPERLRLQRQMALVVQKPLLFRDSVWNNVAYGLRARGRPKPEVDRRVGDLLAQLGMSDMAKRRADTLSGGEAQRIAIARAMAYEPQLLLLDEPTANLDPANVEKIEEMIRSLSEAKSMAVVVVTHNVFQARRLADEVIFVDRGKVIEMGPAEKIFSSPDCEATRLYVEGRMVY